ncbi:hypothetical protein AJ80_03248 [Polytolypa hystricis UAMH7299]|uniref:Uncharacterized protein n=1 Tax=Polytolypa hystricis (strain UAMH7299) TaxID=1447883 RepID=A0A2B7YLG8_POLH7|nr:hypothetical protein AJ80_03248 [Polytolypa hystricis UAMH7299]
MEVSYLAAHRDALKDDFTGETLQVHTTATSPAWIRLPAKNTDQVCILATDVDAAGEVVAEFSCTNVHALAVITWTPSGEQLLAIDSEFKKSYGQVR